MLHKVTTTCSVNFHPVTFMWEKSESQFPRPVWLSLSQLLFWLLLFFFPLSSQYGAEFRRFSVDRVKPGKFEEFYKLILHIHRIANMEVMIGYADVHGDLLPINNDDNFVKAVSTAHPLLRIFIQRQGKLIHTVWFPSPLYTPQITSLILV